MSSYCPVDSLNCTKEDLTVSVAIDGLEQEVRLSAEHNMDEAKVGFGEIQLFFASLLFYRSAGLLIIIQQGLQMWLLV